MVCLASTLILPFSYCVKGQWATSWLVCYLQLMALNSPLILAISGRFKAGPAFADWKKKKKARIIWHKTPVPHYLLLLLYKLADAWPRGCLRSGSTTYCPGSWTMQLITWFTVRQCFAKGMSSIICSKELSLLQNITSQFSGCNWQDSCPDLTSRCPALPSGGKALVQSVLVRYPPSPLSS